MTKQDDNDETLLKQPQSLSKHKALSRRTWFREMIDEHRQEKVVLDQVI